MTFLTNQFAQCPPGFGPSIHISIWKRADEDIYHASVEHDCCRGATPEEAVEKAVKQYQEGCAIIAKERESKS